MSKHYDVVILGAGLGALTTAALLARRSWRVLVLGQGWRPAHYSFDGLPLARRPFTFLGGSSPAWTRALAELAQSQSFRRHARPLDPMLQVLAPRLRLSIPADGALLGREIDREFPEVRRVVDDLYADLARTERALRRGLQSRSGLAPWHVLGTARDRARRRGAPVPVRAGTRAARGVPSRALLPQRRRSPRVLREQPRGQALAVRARPPARGVDARRVRARARRGRPRRLPRRPRERARRRGKARRPRLVRRHPARARDGVDHRGGRRADGCAVRRERADLVGHARSGVRLPAVAPGARRAAADADRRAAVRREPARARRRPARLARDGGVPPARSGVESPRGPPAEVARRDAGFGNDAPRGGDVRGADLPVRPRGGEARARGGGRHGRGLPPVRGAPLRRHRLAARRPAFVGLPLRQAGARGQGGAASLRRVDRSGGDDPALSRRRRERDGARGARRRAGPLHARGHVRCGPFGPACSRTGRRVARGMGGSRIITRTDRRKEQMRREMWNKVELR